MSISNVVNWWEEWQLRILVLGSLAIQLYLAFFAPFRKWPGLGKLYRLIIWLSYLGGDALAIYALATLFNRQKKLQYSSSYLNHGGSHDLEVLWAPILLMHLGGRMTISAYNIEDNELWLRHIGVAVSQVTVTLYVFCTSWSPSADKKLLAAAVVLFILGIFKCFEKPFALRRASFNALVTYFISAPRSSANKEIELEDYIQRARDIVMRSSNNQQQQADPVPTTLEKDEKESQMWKLSMPDKLFVDYTYCYEARLDKLKFLWHLDFKDTFDVLRGGVSKTFNLIYTKLWQVSDENRDASHLATMFSILLWNITITFPIAPIILFHISHKQAYRGSDIKVTYLLLYITYFSEIISAPGRLMSRRWYSILFRLLFPIFPVEVAQHSLIGVLAGKRRSPTLTCIANLSSYCKDLLQKHFFGRSYKSMETSTNIMRLVHAHIRDGWMSYIMDVESCWMFSDIRGHWILGNECRERVILRDNVEKPFDESIILWHLATDFCFHRKAQSTDSKSVSHCASMCRCISHYMMHLLSANHEMLLPGSRPALFQEACKELDAIPKWATSLWSSIGEEQVTEKVIEKAAEGSQDGFLHDAWLLAQELMQLADAEMWKVIKGVWIEMLCFSAYRCRGYLHAKSLAYGGELLTFVSLLTSHAGLETFAERQQRVQLRFKTLRLKTKEERQRVIVEKEATVKLGEIAAATPSSASASASASASTSQGECTTVPAMEVVVVTS